LAYIGDFQVLIKSRQSSILIAVFIAIFTIIYSVSPLSAAQLKPSESDATTMLKIVSEALDITHISKIKELIVAGADVDVKNKFGATPLHMAAQSGITEVVELLISARADIDKPTERFGVTPLYLAAQNGHPDVVSQLIAAGADVNIPNSRDAVTPLWIAAQEGHADIVAILLKAGSNVNHVRSSDGASPLYIAVEMGHLEVVKRLFDGSPLLKEPKKTIKATKKKMAADGLLGALSLLEDGQEEIKRDIEESKRPVNKIIKVDTADNLGHTPLMLASRKGNREIVEELLKMGADVNASSNKGRTPLMYSAEQGSIDLVKELLSKGANAKAINSEGETALHFARIKEHKRITQILTKTIQADAGKTIK
jgi:ankyrin repeat protein